MNQIYLLAWMDEYDGKRHAFFEVSNAFRYCNQNSVAIFVQGEDYSLTVYCDHIHGKDTLTSDELLLVATAYLGNLYEIQTGNPISEENGA